MNAGSVYGGSVTIPDALTVSYQCTVYTAGATSATCSGVDAGTEANFPGSSTTTLEASEVSFYPVTITAGLEKLASVSASKTSGESVAKSTASAASTANAITSGSNTASGSKATTSANGGGRIGVRCGVLLAGLAAAFALA